MNDWEHLHRQAARYKQLYPPGTRILLLHMSNDPRPIEDNMRGTVEMVDDLGSVHCSFDNGRRLGMVPGEDQFRKLTEKELLEEQAKKMPLHEKLLDASSRTDIQNRHLHSQQPEKTI